MLHVTTITQTCRSCPSQWEGRTEHGQVIYVRYRWGQLELGVGATFHEAVRRSWFDGKQLGGQYDGTLSYDELRQATPHIRWPDRCRVER